MKKPSQEIVRLEKFVPGGQSLGELPDGRKVFVWGALLGETARVEIRKSKKSYSEGIAVEILESSPQRIAPHDECYISTSPWQILDYDYELATKAELVRESFRQKGIILPESLEQKLDIVTDNRDFFYRNKMEYSLYFMSLDEANLPQNFAFRATFSKPEITRGGKIFLSFHRRGSHSKIPIMKSSIERPEIFADAARIVADLNSRGEEARKFQSLLVRCNQNGEISSALFEKNQPHPIMKNLMDDILGQKYSYSPNGFFQINLPVYEMALREISKHLGDSKKVVDMYAGVGTIGLSVARDRELTLVETDENAFREMRENVSICFEKAAPSATAEARKIGLSPVTTGRHPICASQNNVETFSVNNVIAVHAKSEQALEYITNDITLILDPPRAGLDEKVISRILDQKPPTVIYLSCNPATQARDVAKLLQKYQIIHHQTFNFFPRTPHIENLIALRRNP